MTPAAQVAADTSVKLCDGTFVSRSSEAWRHECEAQRLLSIKLRPAVLAELAEIEKRRGKPATDRLRSTMNQLAQIKRTTTL